MHTARAAGTRTAAASIASQLRAAMAGGRTRAGDFLPSVRRLAEEHGVDKMTARRALKQLASEGLISAEPRRGYRVLAGAVDPRSGAPVAYVFSTQRRLDELTARYRRQISEFENAASRRGWSTLLITAENRTPAEMIEQTRVARSSAMVLDTENAELISRALASRTPAVLVDAWRPEVNIDSVMQDGHQGGLLAAEHLAARGHKRIAVVAPPVRDAHSADRFGGAVAGLARAGLDLPADLRITTQSDAGARSVIREVLARRDAPTAFIVLWTNLAVEIAAAIRDQGLCLGRDCDMVGWCNEELYAESYAPRFGGETPPPAITWSLATMAETALVRLAERRNHPDAPALRVRIPVQLRIES